MPDCNVAQGLSRRIRALAGVWWMQMQNPHDSFFLIVSTALVPHNRFVRLLLGAKRHTSSPDIFACLKYFMPTQAIVTQTQAITVVSMIKAG